MIQHRTVLIITLLPSHKRDLQPENIHSLDRGGCPTVHSEASLGADHPIYTILYVTDIHVTDSRTNMSGSVIHNSDE